MGSNKSAYGGANVGSDKPADGGPIECAYERTNMGPDKSTHSSAIKCTY